MERVFVTGLGVASALGCSVDEFWDGLTSGHSGVFFWNCKNSARLATRIGALVTGYEEGQFFTRKEKRRLSRSSQLAIVAAAQAIESAGLIEADINPLDVGVIIGSSIGGYSASDPFFGDFYSNKRLSPLTIPLSMNVGPSANVSIRFGFRGPMMSVDAACASGAHSIAHASMMIRIGMLQVAVTGGADSPFSPGVVAAWEATRALSNRNDTPKTACRPFSADRDGLVLGEGAGILVLESESSARRRGAKIWAEIKGYGASSDSYHLTQPTQQGPAQAMLRALEDAGFEPGNIDYINAHGTGTRWNDPNETAAIKTVFGEHAYQIPVVSNMAAIGHTIAASGALKLIGGILSLRDQVIPPTINYTTPDPECDLNYVTQGSIPCKVENVLSNSFAFGGSNASLVVGTINAL